MKRAMLDTLNIHIYVPHTYVISYLDPSRKYRCSSRYSLQPNVWRSFTTVGLLLRGQEERRPRRDAHSSGGFLGSAHKAKEGRTEGWKRAEGWKASALILPLSLFGVGCGELYLLLYYWRLGRCIWSRSVSHLRMDSACRADRHEQAQSDNHDHAQTGDMCSLALDGMRLHVFISLGIFSFFPGIILLKGLTPVPQYLPFLRV